MFQECPGTLEQAEKPVPAMQHSPRGTEIWKRTAWWMGASSVGAGAIDLSARELGTTVHASIAKNSKGLILVI